MLSSALKAALIAISSLPLVFPRTTALTFPTPRSPFRPLFPPLPRDLSESSPSMSDISASDTAPLPAAVPRPPAYVGDVDEFTCAICTEVLTEAMLLEARVRPRVLSGLPRLLPTLLLRLPPTAPPVVTTSTQTE